MARLTDHQISEIEAEIIAGNTNQIRDYYTDAVTYYLVDRDELHRRRMLIGRGCFESSDTFSLFALLSVLLNDKQGWDIALDQLGRDFDPGFEYLAFLLRAQYFQDSDLGKWDFLLENASSQGHIPAKVVYWKRFLGRNLFLRFFLLKPIVIILGLKAACIAFKNPNDRRLTSYTTDGRNFP